MRDRPEVGTGHTAPPTRQPRARQKATSGANSAHDVTVDQTAAREARAARRNEQRTAQTNSAEIHVAERTETDPRDQSPPAPEQAAPERADTGTATHGLNTPAGGSRASVATRTPAVKRGRPTSAGDTSDERELKRDRGQGQKRGHTTTPTSEGE